MNVPKTSAGGTAPGPPAPNPAPVPERKFVDVMGETRAPPALRPAPPVSPPPTGPPPVAAAKPGEQPLWQRSANQAVQAEKRLDALIDAAQKGKTFTAAELIALQAQVFRYSQTVEVISRTTDKVVGGIKQILGTQV